MRICWLSPNCPTVSLSNGSGGGIGTYCMYAARGLAALGHKTHVIVPVWRRGRDLRDGEVAIHLRHVRQLPVVGDQLLGLGESVCLAAQVTALHRRYGFDLIEVPNYEGWGAGLARLFRSRLVMRFHSSRWSILVLRGQEPAFGERFNHWLDRDAVRACRTFVTHSLYEMQQARLEYGLDRETISIVPHGIAIPPRRRLIRGRARGATLTILYVGRMEERKGAAVLIRAIPQVLEEVPGARFVLVGQDKPQAPGGGLHLDFFRDQCPRKYWDRVEFTGHLPADRVHARMRTCDVFVAPSLSESFGYTHLEAMSWGRPVVGCRAGATPEIVTHGKAGLLVEPKDARDLARQILILAKDPGLRLRMGRAARARVEEHYSIHTMAAALERFYRGCLSTRE